MENASLSSDDVTTSSPTDADDLMRYIVGIRNVAVKIVYIITGTVGVIDNLFVIVVFALFIKIADKVLCMVFSFLRDAAFRPSIRRLSRLMYRYCICTILR